MNIAAYCLYSFVVLLALANVVVELRRTAMMAQQNSYRVSRYMRWLKTSGDTTSYSRLIGFCVFFASVAAFTRQGWGALLIGIFAAGSWLTLARCRYKKPLVVTARVRRIFGAMIVMSLLVVAGFQLAAGLYASWLTRLYVAAVSLVAIFCASHIITLGAVWIMLPVERRIAKGYVNDAASILRSMPNLKVVGITGSYGKTSTKHFLYTLLSEQYETLMTPGSYNTTMGVVRTVREMMKPYTEVFICEMGAKQPGDIKEICDLVHPEIGIVTAVGPQHLESFKTIERVGQTKFELVDALPADGLAVVNADFPYAASRQIDNVDAVTYGIDAKDARFTAEDISYTPRGTEFTLVDNADGSRTTYSTSLLGQCNVSNLIACVIVARQLGVTEEKIRRAMEQIEAVEHRLSVKRTPGGVTILDDAFNSNPSGSAMALQVLGQMQSGRRIVVTPGMIELGDSQYELNRQMGEAIARHCDIAIVVGQYNRQALLDGIAAEEGSKVEVITVDSFAESQTRLAGILKSGDVVLYENDLPDTFK